MKLVRYPGKPCKRHPFKGKKDAWGRNPVEDRVRFLSNASLAARPNRAAPPASPCIRLAASMLMGAAGLTACTRPAESEPADLAPARTDDHGGDRLNDDRHNDEPPKGPPAPRVGTPVDEPVATRRTATRVALCDSYGTPAMGHLTLGDQPLVWVHCGARISLLWLPVASNKYGDEPSAPPQEVLALDYTSLRPDAHALPGDLVVGDLNVDGLDDLVLGLPVVDGQDAPGGGSVYIMHGSSTGDGGLEAPERLFGAHAVSVTFGASARPDQQSLLVVHGEDARSNRISELWHIDPGPAPSRGRIVPLAAGARLLDAIDLDGDRLVDPVVVDAGGAARVFLTGRDATPSPADDTKAVETWPTTGILANATGDLNADGHPDLVLLGEQVWLVLGRPEPAPLAPAPVPLPDVMCPSAGCGRDLQVLDVDKDSFTDLVMYHHPEIVVFRQVDQLRFERTPWLSVIGDGVSVMDTLLLDADCDEELDLFVLVKEDGTHGYSLAMVRGVGPDTEVDVSAPDVPIPSVPLRPSHHLP